MFCRLRQCRQILPKLILLPYLLFFFYVHNVSFFSTPLSPSCEEGVLNPLPSPRPFQKGKGCNRPTVLFF